MRMPRCPWSLPELIQSYPAERMMEIVSSGIGSLPKGKYLHWDKLRHLAPPDGFSSKDWWLAIKFKRSSARHALPLHDARGTAFSFSDTGDLYQRLHQVDRDASGRIEVPSINAMNSGHRDRYFMNSLIEEAITSSQLEGAATTRRVAKEMLRSGRQPHDRSERMILNNYRGMTFLRDAANENLTPSLLLELQRILTEGTLDLPDAVGRFRQPDDEVHVVDQRDGEIVHTPPDASRLDERMASLLDFANGRAANDEFLHPVVKAIFLHFMIGYEHPFVDGNGRTARALFYWAMARAGYWLTEFLSISSLIRRSPAQYVRAYVLSEIDDCDATYFLDYNLRVILDAIQQLHLYLERKTRETSRLETLLRHSKTAAVLNHRQIALIGHMLKHPDTWYAIDGHRRAHNVTYQTARTDLAKLDSLGFLVRHARGRRFLYRRRRDLEKRLAQVADQQP